MKTSELRTKDEKGLKEELSNLRQSHFILKMQLGSGQLNQTHKIKEVRKAIARVLTLLTEMKRASA